MQIFASSAGWKRDRAEVDAQVGAVDLCRVMNGPSSSRIPAIAIRYR